jgi:hypothetical protein
MKRRLSSLWMVINRPPGVNEGSSLCLLARHAGKGLEPSLTEICERCRFDEAKNL